MSSSIRPQPPPRRDSSRRGESRGESSLLGSYYKQNESFLQSDSNSSKNFSTSHSTSIPTFMQSTLESTSKSYISRFGLLLGVLHLKQAPFQASQYRVEPKNFWQWKSSFLLCLILIAIAVIFNSFVPVLAPAKEFVDTQGRVCKAPTEFVLSYAELLKKITSFSTAQTQSGRAFNISRALFEAANKTHQPLLASDSVRWPQPYQPTAADQELLQNELSKTCFNEICQDVLITVGSTSQVKTVCTKIAYDCTDPAALKTVSSGNATQDQSKLLDLATKLGAVANSTSTTSLNNADFQKAVLDQLTILQYRVNLVASIYVLWMAVTIYVGSPFHIALPPVSTRLQSWIGGISKIQYVVFVVLIIYAVEYIQMLLINPDFLLIIGNISANPCWLDTALVSKIYNQTTALCGQLVDSRNSFNSANQSIHFYANVEKTWTRSPPGQAQIYPTDLKSLNLTYSGQMCTDVDIFKQLLKPPADAPSVNIVGMIFKTGILARFFLQPVLAHLIVCIFQILFPLSTTAGRVLLPISVFSDVLNSEKSVGAVFHSTLNRFVRVRNVIPLIIYSIFLILVLYGLLALSYLAVFVIVSILVVTAMVGILFVGMVWFPRREREAAEQNSVFADEGGKSV
ncbi:hypothetical protein HK098_002636 [Nowakowskiella sp. JEL0407]|nr:hypothetical protein HK098_002636 [Nowakowskiella sp. JEL0407]